MCAMTDDGPEYEIEFRWKEQVYYWEGNRGLYLDGGWGVDPVATYVPPAETWDDVVPDWAKGRRDEIVRRLVAHPNHQVVEGEYKANLGVTR